VRIAPAHRLLAAFLALWLPFCCCQARAAARTVVHAVHGEAQATACDRSELPPCCRDEGAPAGDSCCGGDEDDGPVGEPGGSAPCGDCAACLSVKVKAIAPDAPPVERDSIGTVDATLCALPASEAAPAEASGQAWPHANAPPWRPGGRTALRLHARLVI
jgi:hypothetical protein